MSTCSKAGCPHEGEFLVGVQIFAGLTVDPKGAFPCVMWIGISTKTQIMFSICKWHQPTLVPADILSEKGKLQVEQSFKANRLAAPDWARCKIITQPITHPI